MVTAFYWVGPEVPMSVGSRDDLLYNSAGSGGFTFGYNDTVRFILELVASKAVRSTSQYFCYYRVHKGNETSMVSSTKLRNIATSGDLVPPAYLGICALLSAQPVNTRQAARQQDDGYRATAAGAEYASDITRNWAGPFGQRAVGRLWEEPLPATIPLTCASLGHAWCSPSYWRRSRLSRRPRMRSSLPSRKPWMVKRDNSPRVFCSPRPRSSSRFGAYLKGTPRRRAGVDFRALRALQTRARQHSHSGRDKHLSTRQSRRKPRRPALMLASRDKRIAQARSNLPAALRVVTCEQEDNS